MNGLYEISNLGNVRRLRFINSRHNFEKIRMCKQTLNTWGYMTVNLSKNGKSNTKRVHRLVATTFLGDSNLQVDHIDGNKQNNKVDNLEWTTHSENIKHSYTHLKRVPFSPSKGKFGKESKSSKAIKQYTLDGKFLKRWDSKIEASKELKIDAGSMSKCCNKIRKSAGGFIWRYE